MTRLLIYGATGYTGRLISDRAESMRLDFIIAGRSEDSVLAAAAARGVPHRVFDLVDEAVIDQNLAGITVLLNCAGPFQHTAKRLIDACIRNRVHYLDTSAELISYNYAAENDTAAKAAGVMLIPGGGGSTAMLGCLAARVIDRTTGPVVSVDLALHVSGPMSRGSAITASQNIKAETLQRYDGALTSREATDTALFDFGQGPVDCFPVTLPDLVTVHKFFGIPNIRTFAYASGTAFPSGDLDTLPAGPTAEERDANPYNASVTVTTASGEVQRATLHSVNGYTYIAIVSAEVARRVLAEEVVPGFQMSAIPFGPAFADSVAGNVVSSIAFSLPSST